MYPLKVSLCLVVGLLLNGLEINAQIVTTTPAFPTADQPITIVYDATQGATGLIGATRVFMHSGVILTDANGTDWQHVIGTWGSPTSPGEMTSLGNNKWSITLTPRNYYAPAGLAASANVYRLGMVFREAGPCGGFGGNSANCKEGKAAGSQNIYVEMSQGGFDVNFTAPSQFPLFKNSGDVLSITGGSSQSSTLTVKVNGVLKKTEVGATQIVYDHTVVESGVVTVDIEGNNGSEIKTKSFTYIVRSATQQAARPVGIKDGINYKTGDPSKVTLGLWAPTKTSSTSAIYVVGDFTNWEILPAYQMKRDGEHYWLEISGLTPQQEYGYQYLVDESIWMADPYADKILDTDDQYIPASTYPGLKTYPEQAIHNQSYFNRVAVFETGQTVYDWQVDNFQKPPKEKLVVYELLIRDFFENGERNYQNLIDTLSYFKRLGINAIQLMPIMEFNGNESWGYNPTFMFAPDKYYGTKNKFKEFIDTCHQNGIAVILDIALNHQDIPNPYLMMDYDFASYKPTGNNKWFFTNAHHPFNVFSDMNHGSTYTQQYIDSINYYWLSEYKVDGFRFDLSKGFSTTNYCTTPNCDSGPEVSAWSAYDATRISLLKRMADKIWSHTPNAYVILEHFADNGEEKELAEYHANEGKGMMLWGNLNYSYAQNSMGFSSSSDIGWVYHGSRSWNVPHVVGYMESHDEERMMYRNLQFGSSSENYNIKSLNIALERVKSAAAFFFTIPGPKMIWQFEELGYDISIDFNGRIGNKPVKWDYLDNPQRVNVSKTFAQLINLKQNYTIFNTTDASIQGGTSLLKQIILKNQPYTNTPTSADQMNVVVIGNFNVTTQTISGNFPHTGNWYHYFSQGDTLEVGSSPMSISLQPGEFRIYTDVRLPLGEPELMSFVRPLTPELVSVEESNSKINLNWIDNSEIESGFKIFRKKDGESFQLIGETGVNVTFFEDDFSLTPETRYEYFIKTFNAYESNSSEILSINTSDELITGAEADWKENLEFYPNPTAGKFSFDLESNRISDLKILDIRGKEQKFLRDGNTIDVSNLSAGMYFIKIYDKQGKQFTRKLIKK